MVLSPNDEEVANSSKKKYTQFKTRRQARRKSCFVTIYVLTVFLFSSVSFCSILLKVIRFIRHCLFQLNWLIEIRAPVHKFFRRSAKTKETHFNEREVHNASTANRCYSSKKCIADFLVKLTQAEDVEEKEIYFSSVKSAVEEQNCTNGEKSATCTRCRGRIYRDGRPKR